MAHAQHARLLLPGCEQLLRFRIVEPQPSHHGEALGPLLRRLHGVFVAIALPGLRHDDDAVDAGLIHARDQLIIGEWSWNMRLSDAVIWPRPLGRMRFPDVD